MEIIKRGKHPDEQKYDGTCRNCKTEVRFKKSEAEYVSDQRDGDFLRVRCPLCSEYINVGT